MKTPMQQHMEWLHEKYISHLQDEETGLALEVWYCLKNAEQMLEKEKEAIMNAYDIGWSDGNKDQDLNDLYYFETFNTKEK